MSSPTNYLHSDFNLEVGDTVVVTLDGQANVLLMDWSNYEAYRNGRSYRYHGGLAEKTPVRIEAPANGHWYLVVDLGGFAGTVRAGVSVEKARRKVLR